MKNNDNKFEPGDYYWDKRGFRIFTEQYLLRRGYCCKDNCKHCPYGFSGRNNPEHSKSRYSDKIYNKNTWK